MLSGKNSKAAAEYAQKKKIALEKANRLRSERDKLDIFGDEEQPSTSRRTIPHVKEDAFESLNDEKSSKLSYPSSAPSSVAVASHRSDSYSGSRVDVYTFKDSMGRDLPVERIVIKPGSGSSSSSSSFRGTRVREIENDHGKKCWMCSRLIAIRT